ncbi:predicted protein [Naegleria gruberi]|uniref:Predicted protein n=1 Tax=Naegleria gruberi TaxID=5762 RepID=D2VVI9_NAEGR|nr:uncharacterized protein NAEGRDRAFT_73035 [Naegleria gruberi]EFC39041.1 predicted protein [Naegleria gruberi]|eukprot:XP_002671785.1 predicted protein [Naegleria gruberi strain NEG-M]
MANNGETQTALIGKSIAVLVVFCSAWVGAILPFAIKKFNCTFCSDQRQATILSLVNCLSGGFFISAAFYHILISSVTSFKQLTQLMGGKGISAYGTFPFMLASIGFVLPLFVHNILNAFTAKIKNEQNQDHESDDTNQLYALNSDINELEEKKESGVSYNKIVSYVLSTVLSCQSVLIGVTSGVITDSSDAMVLICTMILHKWVAAFSISVSSIRAGLPFWTRTMPLMLVFSLMTPIGIIIGILLVRFVTDKVVFLIVGIIFKSLGAGFFIYVSTMIILRNEIALPNQSTSGCHSQNAKNEQKSITSRQRNVFLLKLLFVFIGYMIMTIPYNIIGKAIANH